MSLRAAQKREIAKVCLNQALSGDFREASHTRQQAYAMAPLEIIGVGWDNFEAIWRKDSEYLHYLNLEPFDDLHNSLTYIQSFRAALFVDELFQFRDMWSIEQIIKNQEEKICCPDLEEFLRKNDWDFKCQSREYIYARTVKTNINYKICMDKCKKDGIEPVYIVPEYPPGEYSLGFLPGTPEKIIDSRRRWLQNYQLFEDCKELPIEKFPKTFKTFEKHMFENSEKYQAWMRQYSELISNNPQY